MPIVRFFGRVLPLHRKVNLTGHPGVVWDAVELGLTIAFRIQIAESIVIVDCEMERFEKDKDFLDLYLRASASRFPRVRSRLRLTMAWDGSFRWFRSRMTAPAWP